MVSSASATRRATSIARWSNTLYLVVDQRLSTRQRCCDVDVSIEGMRGSLKLAGEPVFSFYLVIPM